MIKILVILLAFQILQSLASSNDNNQTILFGYTINGYKNIGNKYKLYNLLSTFSSQTANTEFYNSTLFGRSPNNNLHGLYMCRGDIDLESCRVCIKYATDMIVMRQSYAKEAMYWYDHCMLRYSNQPFIGKLDNNTHMIMSTWENANTTDNPTHFTNTLRYTISLLAVQAAGSRKKFATKIVKFKEGKTLYTLVQCTPDLSANDCRKCLTKSIERVREMGASKGGKVIQLNCMVRYEMFPFFYTDKIKSFDSTGINSAPITFGVQFKPVPLYNDSINSTSSSPSFMRASTPMIIKLKGQMGTSSIDNGTIKATICFPSTVVSNSTMIKHDGSKIGDRSE